MASLLALPDYLAPKYQLNQSSVFFHAGLGVERLVPIFGQLQIRASIGVDYDAKRVLRCQEQIAAFTSKRAEEPAASLNCASRVLLVEPLTLRTVKPATHVSICTQRFTVMAHLVNAAALSPSVKMVIVIVPNPAWLCDIGLLSHGTVDGTTRKSVIEDDDVHNMIVELEQSDAICYFIPFTAARRKAILEMRALSENLHNLVIAL
jgi:hypothetical protein